MSRVFIVWKIYLLTKIVTLINVNVINFGGIMVKEVNLAQLREEAEDYFTEGDYYCSEAIVAAIRMHFQYYMPEQVIAIASAFPVGIGGQQCVCGAIAGGIICLGYFFGRTNPQDPKVSKTMELAKELHSFFLDKHGVACCSVLTKDLKMSSPEHIKQCATFTGEVAQKTAEIIARELDIKIK